MSGDARITSREQRRRAARRAARRHKEWQPIAWLDPPVRLGGKVRVVGVAWDADPEVSQQYGVRFPLR